jgi:hypothetical protein
MLKDFSLYILMMLFIASCNSPEKLARTPVVVSNGDHFYRILLDSIYLQQDSLAKWNKDGVVFFRMDYRNNHFVNVRNSENTPPLLVRIVKNVSTNEEVQVNKKTAGKYYFVLPIRYDFAGNKSGSLHPMLDATPKVDISKITDKPINWFNLFFDMDTSTAETRGHPCILLPWLFLKGKEQ